LVFRNDFWVRLTSSGTAKIGISDFLQQNLSDIMYVELPEPGRCFDQFEEIATIESTKSVSYLISPVSGKVLKVNAALKDKPDLLNSSPYEDGWLLEVELTNFKEDKELLMTCEEYFTKIQTKIESEFKKL
jgi:glycine cleavage system H protein